MSCGVSKRPACRGSARTECCFSAMFIFKLVFKTKLLITQSVNLIYDLYFKYESSCRLSFRSKIMKHTQSRVVHNGVYGDLYPEKRFIPSKPQRDIFSLLWTNAQRDGRPTEYGRRPLFNAAKFGWCPLLECRAVTLPSRYTRWNLQGFPKLTKRSQPLVGRSSPYYEDMWKRYCCLTSFFPIVDTCLSCEDIARQNCGMVARWRLFGDFFCVLYFQRAARSTF